MSLNAEETVAAAAPVNNAEKDSDAALDASLDKVFDKYLAGGAGDETPAPVKEAAPQEAPAGTTEEAAPKTEEAAQKPESTEAESKEQSVPPVPAPNGWDDDAVWQAMPRHAQEYIAQREAKLAEETNNLRQFQQAWKPIEEMAKPYEQTLAMHGQTVDQGLRQLMAVNDFAIKSDPLEYINWYCQQRGVQLQALLQEREIQEGYGDPAQQMLVNKLHRLESQLQHYDQRVRQIDQQAIDTEIESFAATHPHFSSVKMQMGKLMQAGFANNLEEAYHQAIRLQGITPAAPAVTPAAAPVSNSSFQPQPSPIPASTPAAPVQSEAVAKAKKMQGVSLNNDNTSNKTKPLNSKLDDIFDKYGIQ